MSGRFIEFGDEIRKLLFKISNVHSIWCPEHHHEDSQLPSDILRKISSSQVVLAGIVGKNYFQYNSYEWSLQRVW